MKHTVLGISVLVVGMMAIWPARANQCHGGHTDDKSVEKTEPTTAEASDKEIKFQTTCPVMGGAIDKNQYVDHDGKRVYICCKGCEAPLKKDPATYIKKLEDAGVTVATLQTQCPVMGGAIDTALYVDHGGKRIYVCCQGCIAIVKKDPAKTIQSMEAAGVALYATDKADKAVEPKKKVTGHEGHGH